MSNTKNYQVLSGSALKVIAMVSMLIDHTAAYVLSGYQWARTPFFVIGSHSLSVYRMMRIMGRIAFPIFCFLLVEGFIYTSNRIRYGRNLLIFAVISEMPWNLVHADCLFYKGQNVFFTLFLGYAALCVIEKYKDCRKKQLIGLLIGLLIAILLRADYGVSGYGFIIMLYALKDSRIIRAIVGSCFLSNPYYAGIAFMPIALYNGKRGFIKGKISKYAFYAFYPVHMLVLYVVRTVLIMG
jgi:hypothetical protein